MLRRLVQPLCCGFIMLILAAPLAADDWPQWLGPQRDSVWRESGIIEKFPEGGPKVLWRVPVAGGYAGPAVAGDRVLVCDFVPEGSGNNDPNNRSQVVGKERVLCFDRNSGQPLWKHEYPCTYDISYPAGPRATPTVDGELVYTLGAEGDLTCLELAPGKVRWQLNFKKQFGAPTPIWGFCSHPLVDGDTLFTLAGGPGSVAIALDKRTGALRWKALDAPDAGYCPPMMIEAGGRKQLVVWHPKSLNGLDPASGQTYWSVPLEPDYGMSIVAPRRSGPYLFAGGVIHKGVMLRLADDKPAVEELWRTSRKIGIGPVHSPVIPYGELLYGVNREGDLTGLEPATGKRLWETFEATSGRRTNSATAFMVRNDDRFFIFNDLGYLIIARLAPDGYHEIDRAKILEPTNEAFGRPVVWSHPAYAHRSIFARNDQELVCISLAKD